MNAEFIFDVSDLVEFYTRGESASGVQRVVAGISPDLIHAGGQPVVLDRARGVFTPLSQDLGDELLVRPGDRGQLMESAKRALLECAQATEITVTPGSVFFFPGAAWISDALMTAARGVEARGAKLVFLLYDLTPVIDVGHTAAVNSLFDRYLTLVADCAVRAPAISTATRTDFERWCDDAGRRQIPGRVTRLPNALTPAQPKQSESEDRIPPWPRPYALMVGTVESRKNHVLAFRVWQRLIEAHGESAVPDLVCIGRLGWHAEEFLRDYTLTSGLNGKISVLSDSVSDDELARFYEYASFTIYPSNYEGWGLPVSESLAFGVPVVCARNSSLPEAGGSLAIYCSTGDEDEFVGAIENELLPPERNAHHRQNITNAALDLPTWHEVAATIIEDIQQAREDSHMAHAPRIELGQEYVFAQPEPPLDGAHADRYLEHLHQHALTPLLRQPRRAREFEITDALLVGQLGSPQTWGLEIHPGRPVTMQFIRPTSGDLVVLVGTRSMPGVVRVSISGPGGPAQREIHLGGVLEIGVGAGAEGELAQAVLSVTDASDTVEGFMGVISLVVLSAEDLTTQVIALQAANSALRQELDFITNTRSWRITAPLRQWKGRGSSGR